MGELPTPPNPRPLPSLFLLVLAHIATVREEGRIKGGLLYHLVLSHRLLVCWGLLKYQCPPLTCWSHPTRASPERLVSLSTPCSVRFGWYPCRYPFDEAASVALKTLQASAEGIKEVRGTTVAEHNCQAILPWKERLPCVLLFLNRTVFLSVLYGDVSTSQ